MSVQSYNRWAKQVERLAADFPYPPSPDFVAIEAQRLVNRMAHQHQPRRWQVALVAFVAFVLLMVGLFGLSPVRAALLEWFQVGAVRIWQIAPPTPTIGINQRTTPSTMPPARATLVPTGSGPQLLSMLDFAGETTVDAVQAEVDFPILLPMLPTDLGRPDRVFLQRAEGDTVILVWMNRNQPETVRMSLHILGPGAFLWKIQPPVVAEAQVNGLPAYWTDGPYYIQTGGSWGNRRLVEGHVLVWLDGEMTYRLESNLPLAEAVQIAESLRILSPINEGRINEGRINEGRINEGRDEGANEGKE